MERIVEQKIRHPYLLTLRVGFGIETMHLPWMEKRFMIKFSSMMFCKSSIFSLETFVIKSFKLLKKYISKLLLRSSASFLSNFFYLETIFSLTASLFFASLSIEFLNFLTWWFKIEILFGGVGLACIWNVIFFLLCAL